MQKDRDAEDLERQVKSLFPNNKINRNTSKLVYFAKKFDKITIVVQIKRLMTFVLGRLLRLSAMFIVSVTPYYTTGGKGDFSISLSLFTFPFHFQFSLSLS